MCYTTKAGKTHAGIAQSVEQLIRNQQVVCSSHITSSRWKSPEMLIKQAFPGIIRTAQQAQDGEITKMRRQKAGEDGTQVGKTWIRACKRKDFGLYFFASV